MDIGSFAVIADSIGDSFLGFEMLFDGVFDGVEAFVVLFWYF